MNDKLKKSNVVIALVAFLIITIVGISNTKNLIANVMPHFLDEKILLNLIENFLEAF